MCVEWLYDGLGGSVIQWTKDHGNTNDDPSVLAWILDPDGEELASGSGKIGSASSMVKWLEENAKASFPMVDPTSYEVLRKQATSIAQRRKLGATLAELRQLAAGGEDVPAEERAEAERMLAEVTPFLEWKLKRAEELKSTNPAAVMPAYQELAAELAGDVLGDQAKETLAALKKDKEWKAELKAWAMLSQVDAMEEEMKPCAKRRLELDTCDDCRSKNEKAMGKASQVLQVILKKYPDSAAAREATKRLASWVK